MDIAKIYKITNLINGKIYIGQTWQSIRKRFLNHCSYKGRIMGNAIRKYGKDNFTIEALVSTRTQEDADYLEIYFIELYDSIKSGYNLKEGGGNGRHTESTKKKLSEWHKGKCHSEETKEKIRLGNLGKSVSSETRSKLGVWKGRKRTASSKKNLSEAMKNSTKLQKQREALIGAVFGYLTVIELCPREESDKKYKSQYLCLCSCGNKKKILGQALKAGQFTCGRECKLWAKV